MAHFPLRKFDFILFSFFVFFCSMLFLLVNIFYKGDKLIQFFADFFVFFFAVIIATGSIFLFGSILVSFFNKNNSNNKNDLPLNMIYKSKEEVEQYRKLNNIPTPKI